MSEEAPEQLAEDTPVEEPAAPDETEAEPATDE